MRLTKACQYGLIALRHATQRGRGEAFSLEEVAGATGLPAPYLAKILTRLVHAGLLDSSRGKRAGYALALAPEAVSLKRAVEALDGARALRGCLFSQSACSAERPCLLHAHWERARGALERQLAGTTLAQWATPPAGLNSKT